MQAEPEEEEEPAPVEEDKAEKAAAEELAEEEEPFEATITEQIEAESHILGRFQPAPQYHPEQDTTEVLRVGAFNDYPVVLRQEVMYSARGDALYHLSMYEMLLILA